MNKKFFLGGLTCFFLVMILVLVGCSIKQTTTDEVGKIKIAATIFPLYDIVREVGGEKIEPILVLPPGSSPHTYEVSPSQIKEMQGTKIFFTIGAGADDWAQNISNSIEGVEVISLDKYIDLKPFFVQEHKQKEEDEHEHGSLDPHYWLEPNNAKIMANKIALRLGSLDQENERYYQSEAEDFIAKLNKKDTEWKNKLNNLEGRELVVFHDAWGYFADYFDLKIIASFEPFPGKTPSPQYLKELQEKVKEHEITSLFVEPQLSKEAIKTFAHDLKVNVEVLDPLGGTDERQTYIDLIDFNVNNIYKSLK